MGYDIFDACCASEHPFFSGFEAEKGLRVIHACMVYTPFYSSFKKKVIKFTVCNRP